MGRIKLSKLVSILLILAGLALLIDAGISFASDCTSALKEVGEQVAYHTDHRAVLDAINQVLKDPQAYGFPPFKNGMTMVDGSQNGGPVPAALPAVLKNLKFEDMVIEPGGSAIINFGGGFASWGLSNYAPDSLPHWELIPGLWFSTDESGSFPRDTSKSPYFQTGNRMLAGSLVLFVIAISLHIREKRRRRKKIEPH